MENNPTLIEGLIDKAEAYGKTTLKLTTYKAIGATADIASGLVSKIVLVIVLLMAILLSSIGLALWLGRELGETFYGFFAVAVIYLVLGILIYMLRDVLIKTPVSNAIISKLQE